jgi:hypothetical protein
MNEYHIFPTSPDSMFWRPPFVVFAASDEAIKAAYPWNKVDRIYKHNGLYAGGFVRIQ